MGVAHDAQRDAACGRQRTPVAATGAPVRREGISAHGAEKERRCPRRSYFFCSEKVTKSAAAGRGALAKPRRERLIFLPTIP